MKNSILVLSVGLFLVTSCSNGQSTKASNSEVVTSVIAKDVEVTKFSKMIENEKYILVDVRTPDEFFEGHIEGAINIDFYDENFKSELSKLDKNVGVLIYCRSGNRSGKSVHIMKNLGFSEMYNLIGGIKAWNSEGLKIVK